MTLEKTVRQIIKDTYGENGQIIDFITKNGSKPGENYGSIITALDITVQTTNKTTTLHWIAKQLPPSEFLRYILNVYVTFPKEISFYQDVLTEYSKLLKENNVDIVYENSFPKFIDAKKSDDNDIFLIMENVKIDGYRLGEISHGLDFKHSTLVMKEIALFHALGIATKLKKPDIYETKIKKTGRSLKEGNDVAAAKKSLSNYYRPFLEYLRGLEEVAELVPRLEKVMEENFLYADMIEGYRPREPFSTLVHNDLWINNVMFKYDDKDTPVSVKILDFQRTKVGSPVSDLMLFLYVSTNLEVMKTKFDALLKFYHDNLVEWLRRLGVSGEDFRWEKFQEELGYASAEVALPVSMQRFLSKKVDVDASEFDLESFTRVDDGEACRTRHIEVLKDMAKRGWI